MVELQPGVRVKSYTLERQLGRGASGEVWKAYDPFKTVAIKFMNESLMSSPNAAKHRVRMEREVEAMQKLQHPNIPVLYDYDLDFPRPFIVMRYVGGDTYDKLIANGEMLRIPLERRLDLIREIAFALTAAHENGIIHRDIKPSNLTGIENPYLLDFSISLEQEEAESTQRFVGTTLYMSPDGQADRLDDNYSFALIAYEILFGRHAIWSPSDQIFNQYIALDRLQRGVWHWPSKLGKNELPADLKGANLAEMDRVFAKALGPREQRYGDLRDFVRDLRAAASPSVTSAHHEQEDYVPTLMMDVSNFKEMLKSQPPVAPAPTPAPVPVPAPQPPSVAMPERPAPAWPSGDHTEIELKTVPYDSLANRPEHPNPPAPDKTELEFQAPSASVSDGRTELDMPAIPRPPQPSQGASGPDSGRTELEMPVPGMAAMPPRSAAPASPTPPPTPRVVQAPTPDASFTLMEFQSVPPVAPPSAPRTVPPPSPQEGGFTMMEMQAPARPQAESFTMMEMQAAQPGGQGDSFTMLEMRAAPAGTAPGQHARRRMPLALRFVVLIVMLLAIVAVVMAVFAAAGVLRFG